MNSHFTTVVIWAYSSERPETILKLLKMVYPNDKFHFAQTILPTNIQFANLPFLNLFQNNSKRF